MTSFIFVRHGQSQANADGLIGTPETPLTEEGKGQARATAELLKDKQVARLVCSPYLRTRQTAEIIAAELGLGTVAVQPLDDLRERNFGELEGEPKTHESEWYYLSDDSGVEPRTALLARMHRCLDELRPLCQQGGTVVVGHATSGFYLMQAAAGKQNVGEMDPPSQMSNAAFIEVTYE